MRTPKYYWTLAVAIVTNLLVWAPLTWPADVTRIAVISDINGRYGSTSYHRRVSTAVSRIIELQPHIVISTGDMVAGQRLTPKLQRAELEEMWRSFHEHVRKPLEDAGIPLLMTPGNHDASAYPGFELEREAYAAYHNRYPPALPLSRPDHFPYHYAVEYQGMLLVSLDATTSGTLAETQRQWLEVSLNSTTKYRATLAFGHLPLQPVAIGRERDVISDPALEALMAASGLTIYLSGHHHAYYPGYRRGIEMLSVGNLGGNPRAIIGTDYTNGFSFALLEFDAQGQLDISAFQAPNFERAVNISRLPRQIGHGDKKLLRRDIAAQEQRH